MQKSLSRYWLFSGVIALAVAGLFSVVLVLARSPQFSRLIPLNDVFHTALVVHVDLSILVWFLAIAGVIWAREAERIVLPRMRLPYASLAGVAVFGLGIGLITLSPLDTGALPLMSNYIPVLTSRLFFAGLALVAAGLSLGALQFLAATGLRLFSKEQNAWENAQRFGAATMVLMFVVALVYFDLSMTHLQGQSKDTEFYEQAFWAGGHILQFLYTQLLIYVWMFLLVRLYGALPYGKILTGIYALGLLPVALSVRAVKGQGMDDPGFYPFFTDLMIRHNGTAVSFALLLVCFVAWKKRGQTQGSRALHAALWSSIALFVYGGVLGLMISGQNVTIPAHYHGSIVGVTLALMGFSLALLPEYGYRDAGNWRLAFWQPIVLAFGQILHISGLAWSGGYGVLRKTPGALEEGMSGAKIAMGIMGMGGLLAIIGGLMFVIAVWRAVKKI